VKKIRTAAKFPPQTKLSIPTKHSFFLSVSPLYIRTKIVLSINEYGESSEDVIYELKKNLININGEFMESIAENIICSPIEIEIADVNNDGNKDVLLLTNISTVGAKTPVRINSNVVFLFEIKDGTFQFNHVELGKDQ
jgi:hypothetical protein